MTGPLRLWRLVGLDPSSPKEYSTFWGEPLTHQFLCMCLALHLSLHDKMKTGRSAEIMKSSHTLENEKSKNEHCFLVISICSLVDSSLNSGQDPHEDIEASRYVVAAMYRL